MTRSSYIGVIAVLAALQSPAQQVFPGVRFLPLNKCESIEAIDEDPRARFVRDEVKKLVAELPDGSEREIAVKLLQEVSRGIRDGLCMELRDGEFMARPVSSTKHVDNDNWIVLGDRSSPQIDVDVIAMPDGDGFRYVYLVSNKDQARAVITTWGVITPKEAHALRMEHSTWQLASFRAPARGHMTVSLQASTEARQGPHVVGDGYDFPRWRAPNDQVAIGPGASQHPFSLTSRSLPGPTTAYVGSKETVELPDGPISDDTLEDLKVLARPENFYSSVVTIGPKFGAEIAPPLIAWDWRMGIENMISAGQLSARSPYISSLLESLFLIMTSESDARMPLNIDQQPAAGMESVVDKAVRMALR